MSDWKEENRNQKDYFTKMRNNWVNFLTISKFLHNLENFYII